MNKNRRIYEYGFNKIESKYFILIEKAISYMKQIDDFEHNVKTCI